MSTHRNLTGSDLHENKGVSSAANDTVLTVTSGATVCKKLTADNLTGTGNPFGANLISLHQHKVSGSNGGTLTAATWTPRIWTQRLTNEITGAVWSNEDLTLPAGTYAVEAWAQGYNCGSHQLRLRTTTGTLLITGLSSKASNGAANSTAFQTTAHLQGRFTIATSKTINLEHRVQTTVTGNGQGDATGFGTEVYAQMLVWQVDT